MSAAVASPNVPVANRETAGREAGWQPQRQCFLESIEPAKRIARVPMLRGGRSP